MEKLLNFIILLSLCIIGYALFYSPQQPEVPAVKPGAVAFENLPEPLQTDYKGNELISINDNELDLKIYPKAEYRIYAMVMSKRHYIFGWESKISPYDLALGWDKLMLEENRKGIDYTQDGRWAYYHYNEGYPLPQSYINSHFANNHIIPADENLKKLLDKIKSGDKVYLEGYLVYIKGKLNNGEVWWNSSLTRNDTGDGACEVFYLKRAVINNEVYE